MIGLLNLIDFENRLAVEVRVRVIYMFYGYLNIHGIYIQPF